MARLTPLTINSDKVVEYLKHEIKLKEVQQKILYRQIIQNAAEERNLIVSPEEIQAEADKFRYQNKLESASQTYSWLTEQLITPNDWEAGIYRRILSNKLAECLFGKQVKAYFVQNKMQYEQAVLYRISVPYLPLAQELLYQIEEDEISFFEAAHLYDTDENRRLSCGFEGKFSRSQLAPDLSTQIFGANPHEIIGVIPSTVGYDLWMVEDFVPPELTSETQQQIINHLFHEWLESELNYLIHSQA